ncbi:HelD family protein [Candidatus Omnitrophota bacterium]
MINKTEKDEAFYLEEIKDKLETTLSGISSKVRKYASDIRKQKEYLWENKSGMDHVEKISVRQSVDQSVFVGEAIVAKAKRIRKLLEIPYFGRFDFIREGHAQQDAIYIGVHAFFDEANNASLIHDWRAPISTMFYDYEAGPAKFESPDGTVSGDIVLKRQYRIRKGEMEFMIESDVSIHDDVLQKELSCAADDKMKNIVATIQRDQNAIIRNEKSHVLIIQGVAGSGKTSIALHRIAFLLYRFKESIQSKDLLIISPNKVFADYISNVLPELGEETIPEIGIEELARDLLEREFKFQTFFEQVSLLLENNDNAFKKRIEAKASLDFLEQLDQYILHIKETYFTSVDMIVHGYLVPAWFMAERFKAYKNLPLVNRLNKIAKDVEMNIQIYYNYDVTPEERRVIKSSVKKMFKIATLRGLYKDFYTWCEMPQLCKFMKQSTFEYSDVFPLIYLKMHWNRMEVFNDVKHLLVDEMQDYTPVQYAVMAKLFPCKKTILGDANQSVNPFSSSTSGDIQKVFDTADCVKLCKSYRSTFEITQFAQSISPNADLQAVERHGESPLVTCFDRVDDEIKAIVSMAEDFRSSTYHSMGIICKTEKQAFTLHQKINHKKNKVYLLSSQSQVYIQGIVVCTAHMAKGLEFDHVIVPNATCVNYRTQIDKGMLYVACTRAMHRLSVTYVKDLTQFIQK